MIKTSLYLCNQDYHRTKFLKLYLIYISCNCLIIGKGTGITSVPIITSSERMWLTNNLGVIIKEKEDNEPLFRVLNIISKVISYNSI